jgi:hypothetical protein
MGFNSGFKELIIVAVETQQYVPFLLLLLA